MGQLTELLTGGAARQVVDQAEPALRRIIREERTRLTDALLAGVPWAALSALALIGTRYLVPDMAVAKTAGYAASAALAAIAAWWVYDGLQEAETPPPPPPSAEGPSFLQPVVRQAAAALVDQAEPRFRAILEEERVRVAEAVQAGVPFAVGALAVFFATLFLVKEGDTAFKAAGYSASAFLMGVGAWITLEKEKGIAA